MSSQSKARKARAGRLVWQVACGVAAATAMFTSFAAAIGGGTVRAQYCQQPPARVTGLKKPRGGTFIFTRQSTRHTITVINPRVPREDAGQTCGGAGKTRAFTVSVTKRDGVTANTAYEASHTRFELKPNERQQVTISYFQSFSELRKGLLTVRVEGLIEPIANIKLDATF